MFMNYQSVYTISPGAGTTGTWSLDGQLIPGPLSFGAATYTDSAGVHAVEFINTQIPGATHGDRLAGFLSDFTRWRLAYAAVTIYQDGPDLANQGTVVVCQKPVSPARYTLDAGDLQSAAGLGFHPAFHLEAPDLPNYTTSQSMPNAYFGRSREGAYIPLKLTHSHQAWHSQADLQFQATNAAISSYASNVYGGRLILPTSLADNVSAYPYLSCNDVHLKAGDPANNAIYGSVTSNFCNENWADFSFRNMAVTTSLSLFFRFGFEMQTQPGSVLTPHLKLSPEYDPQSIDTYFKISRELKDGYPADFNDLGKIWDVISSVAKSVAPALTMIPGIGPAVSGGTMLAASMGDRIRGALSRASQPTIGNTASQADIEAVRAKERAAPITAHLKAVTSRPVSARRVKKAKKQVVRKRTA